MHGKNTITLISRMYITIHGSVRFYLCFQGIIQILNSLIQKQMFNPSSLLKYSISAILIYLHRCHLSLQGEILTYPRTEESFLKSLEMSLKKKKRLLKVKAMFRTVSVRCAISSLFPCPLVSSQCVFF